MNLVHQHYGEDGKYRYCDGGGRNKEAIIGTNVTAGLFFLKCSMKLRIHPDTNAFPKGHK
jgi:hypothetical protein